MHIILCILAGLGLANAIVNEKVFKLPRVWLLRLPIIGDLAACMPCTSFWTGYLCGYIYQQNLVQAFLIGLATHFVSRLIDDYGDNK